MGSLVKAVTIAGLAGASIPTAPWVVPFAALVLWSDLQSAATAELTERDAAVIWTMWSIRRTADDTVADADLLSSVNKELADYGRAAISRQELEASLDYLTRIRSVELLAREALRWKLREAVRVSR